MRLCFKVTTNLYFYREIISRRLLTKAEERITCLRQLLSYKIVSKPDCQGQGHIIITFIIIVFKSGLFLYTGIIFWISSRQPRNQIFRVCLIAMTIPNRQTFFKVSKCVTMQIWSSWLWRDLEMVPVGPIATGMLFIVLRLHILLISQWRFWCLPIFSVFFHDPSVKWVADINNIARSRWFIEDNTISSLACLITLFVEIFIVTTFHCDLNHLVFTVSNEWSGLFCYDDIFCILSCLTYLIQTQYRPDSLPFLLKVCTFEYPLSCQCGVVLTFYE